MLATEPSNGTSEAAQQPAKICLHFNKGQAETLREFRYGTLADYFENRPNRPFFFSA